MIDYFGFVAVLVLLALFVWLFLRSLGSKRAILKWVGLILTGLLSLVLVVVFVAAVLGTLKLNTNYGADHPAANLKVAGTPEQVKRGEQIAQICGCHMNQKTLELSGNNFLEGGGPPLGTLYARNLTPGGELKDWTDGEIVRAIREGVHKSGRSLIIMPAEIFKHMSDDDVQSVVAYLRSVPAITPDAPANNLNLAGALFLNIAPFQTVQPHITQPVTAPARSTSAEYGKYVTTIICIGCHGENLAGGTPGGAPVGPNLTAIVPKWSEADFVKVIRTGMGPDGSKVSEQMPWEEISRFATDDDLKALYNYLHSLPTLPTNPIK
jgi:mono/diheme cytochrome c family protein